MNEAYLWNYNNNGLSLHECAFNRFQSTLKHLSSILLHID